MHFRIRGNNVQIVKTVPGEGGQRMQSKPIGSANIATGEISEGAKGSLTEAEIQEVNAWIANHRISVENRNELEFATLADRLRDVAVWVRGADAAKLASRSDDVLEAVKGLRGALLRHGTKAKAG